MVERYKADFHRVYSFLCTAPANTPELTTLRWFRVPDGAVWYLREMQVWFDSGSEGKVYIVLMSEGWAYVVPYYTPDPDEYPAGDGAFTGGAVRLVIRWEKDLAPELKTDDRYYIRGKNTDTAAHKVVVVIHVDEVWGA